MGCERERKCDLYPFNILASSALQVMIAEAVAMTTTEVVNRAK